MAVKQLGETSRPGGVSVRRAGLLRAVLSGPGSWTGTETWTVTIEARRLLRSEACAPAPPDYSGFSVIRSAGLDWDKMAFLENGHGRGGHE